MPFFLVITSMNILVMVVEQKCVLCGPCSSKTAIFRESVKEKESLLFKIKLAHHLYLQSALLVLFLAQPLYPQSIFMYNN